MYSNLTFFERNRIACHKKQVLFELYSLRVVLKIPFGRMEAFFFKKNTICSKFEQLFQIYNFCDFSKKTLNSGGTNNFYEIIPLYRHSIPNLPPSTISNQIQVFLGKLKILYVLNILTISFALYCKFAIIW